MTIRGTAGCFVILLLLAVGQGCGNSAPRTTALAPDVGKEPSATEFGPPNEQTSRTPSEFDRFAEFATMESFQNELYYDRTAPWRARKLNSLGLTNPALREAAEKYTSIAAASHNAILLRDDTYWTNPEMLESLKTQIFGSDLEKDLDLMNTALATYSKAKKLEHARKVAFGMRAEHSRLWARVLSAVKPTGGPDRVNFPLRFGVGFSLFALNSSGQPLHNLTVAIRTNSSNELPSDATLHVVHLERLEPGERISLPNWLLTKRWDKSARQYTPEANAIRCSVWSSEVHFDDVSFDMKPVPERALDRDAAPNGWCKLACFPSADFPGKYDANSPWPVESIKTLPRQASLYGTWIGKDNGTKKEFILSFERVVGVDFIAIKMSVQGSPEDRMPMMDLQGKLRGDKIDFDNTVRYPSDPYFPPRFWGTIRGDQMELNYGRGTDVEGTVSLRFFKAKQ